MVFGTTYCAISHLPINDGDKCILVPLGFQMKYDFDQWNKADVNSFMYLYNFIYEPQEVIYNGNPDDIKYLNKTYESSMSHELYMLIRSDFYNAIQQQYMANDALEIIQNLPLFKTVKDIWEKAKEIESENKTNVTIKMVKGEISKEDWLKNIMNTPTPEWIKNLYKLAMFMDGMGIQPYPNNAVDQHNRNELYEKIRKECQGVK